MIRISTTQIAVGDTIRPTMGRKGIVTSIVEGYKGNLRVVVDTVYGPENHSMRAAGTVELLSDLNGRIPAKSFGRW